MMADTVDTESFIDYIAILSGRNSVYWAFWFAGSTKNTSIGNAMCHKYLILGMIMNTKGLNKLNMSFIVRYQYVIS
jgi:hypothetical protein